MINIRKDNTKKNNYYAVTDKGVIYGGSIEIVERKIKRLNANEKVYNDDSKIKKEIVSNDDYDDMIF